MMKNNFVLLIIVISLFNPQVYCSTGLELSNGCFASAGQSVSADSGGSRYKLFGACGQDVAGALNDDLKTGFIYCVSEKVLLVIGSFPDMTVVKARCRTTGSDLVDGYPTLSPTPDFYWEVPDSTGPVVSYSYSFYRGTGAVINSGKIDFPYIDSIKVEENGEYLFVVRAVNAAGNWGSPGRFAFIYDGSRPLPVKFVNMQNWGEEYFHPLTMNMSFEFTEDLDPGKIKQNSMTLSRKIWNEQFESVEGSVSYEQTGRTVRFVPEQPLKALSEYHIGFNDLHDLAGNSFSGEFIFKTYLGKAMSAEVYSSDGRVRLDIPTWAVESENALVEVRKIDSRDEAVSRADRKVELRLNTKLTESGVYEIAVFDLNNNPIKSFSKNVSMTFFLPDADNNGLWDGSDVRIKDVSMAVLDEAKKDWDITEISKAKLADCGKKAPDKSLAFPVNLAGKYRLISYLAPMDNVDNVMIYPIPFMPRKGHTEVTFLRLPSNTEINIYNIAGEFVCRLSAPDQGQIIWKAKNNHGEDVASGVYLAMIKSNGSKKIYKIAVQR